VKRHVGGRGGVVVLNTQPSELELSRLPCRREGVLRTNGEHPG